MDNFVNNFITPSTEFICKIKTDNAGGTASNQIGLPSSAIRSANYFVDWGDGTSQHIVAGVSGSSPAVHTYSSPGIYTLRFRGRIPQMRWEMVGEHLKLIEILQFGNIGWEIGQNAFINCSNLVVTATDGWHFRDMTSAQRLFQGVPLFNPDVSKWDLSNLGNMFGMFNGCVNFNQPVGHFNVKNVTNMNIVLQSCGSFQQSLAGWDVRNVVGSIDCAAFGATSGYLNTANYSETLLAWAQLPLQQNVTCRIGTYYTSAAAVAKQYIIDNFNWTFQDLGLQP